MTSKLIAFPVSQKSARTEKPPSPSADGGFQILILAELPYPPCAPVIAVVVVVVVQTTTLAGVGAEDTGRIGLSSFNLVIQ
jgi:hypothetical protein